MHILSEIVCRIETEDLNDWVVAIRNVVGVDDVNLFRLAE